MELFCELIILFTDGKADKHDHKTNNNSGENSRKRERNDALQLQHTVNKRYE